MGSALDLVGNVLRWVGLAFVVPAGVAVGYGESPWPFLLSGAITAAAGYALDRLTGDRRAELVGPREGFLIIALVWLLVPAFGALPFLLAGGPQLSRPVDAYFESVSGFTATGATVLTDIEALGHGVLFWRQLSHWLGGMGIIVLAVAVLPRLRIGGRHLLQSELAGPTEIEQLGATIRQTARRLWRLYAALTVIAALVLSTIGWLGLDPAMDPFEAVAHALSAIALGGFSTQTESLAAFAPLTQWVVLSLMILAGINFLRLYRLAVQRRMEILARDEEVRLYLAFIVTGSALIVLELLVGGFERGFEAVRHGVFQAVAILTTTGFATADYTEWGALATLTLMLLMFVGASAGSTGGSIKIVRHLLLFKVVRRELEQTVHREAVVPIRVTDTVIDDRTLRSTVVFVLLYLLTFALGALLLVLDGVRSRTSLTTFDTFGAAAACLGNVGPAFGPAGPFGSYAGFSDLSTVLLTLLMWLGRVEIIPIAVLLTRNYWRA